jgi:hypothetical protein
LMNGLFQPPAGILYSYPWRAGHSSFFALVN